MQVAIYLAGEITQVKESIPGVRCASGNVSVSLCTHGAQAVCVQSAFTVFWTILNSLRPFYHLRLLRQKLNFLTNSTYVRRCTQDTTRISLRYIPQNIPKISPKYPLSIPQISPKYHFGAYHRPLDGHFLLLRIVQF